MTQPKMLFVILCDNCRARIVTHDNHIRLCDNCFLTGTGENKWEEI